MWSCFQLISTYCTICISTKENIYYSSVQCVVHVVSTYTIIILSIFTPTIGCINWLRVWMSSQCYLTRYLSSFSNRVGLTRVLSIYNSYNSSLTKTHIHTHVHLHVGFITVKYTFMYTLYVQVCADTQSIHVRICQDVC